MGEQTIHSVTSQLLLQWLHIYKAMSDIFKTKTLISHTSHTIARGG